MVLGVVERRELDNRWQCFAEGGGGDPGRSRGSNPSAPSGRRHQGSSAPTKSMRLAI